MAEGPQLEVDLKNEQVILGALLIAGTDVLSQVLPKVNPDWFTREDHRAILATRRKLHEVGAEYSSETMLVQLPSTVEPRYLATLEQLGSLSEANLSLHLEALERAAAKRLVQEDFIELYGALDDPAGRLEDAAAAASRVLEGLRRGADPGSREVEPGEQIWRPWYEDVERVKREGRAQFQPLHFSALDQWLFEGARPGRLAVVAGRPGMGKTTFANNLLVRQAEHGRRCLSCPLEVGTQATVDQMACARARVEVEKLIKRPDDLTEEELLTLRMAVRRVVGGGNLFFADSRVIHTLDDLERVVSGRGFDVVVLDLFEYAVPISDGDRVNRAVQITEALRRLHTMAERHRFFAVVVAQIKRIKREREKRPKLDELKNSGGYEEVADLILLLHRDRYYDVNVVDDVLEVAVAKQRRGPAPLIVGFDFEAAWGRVGGHRPEADKVPGEARDVE